MSQERNSISSILSCTQYQKPKKQKRISFSRNMVFQEFDEDGTTRTYQEKIDDETSSMLMSLEESECNLFDTTVYDAATMEISSYLSPACSPKTPSKGFRTLSQSPMTTTTLGSPVNGSPVSSKIPDCPKIPDSPVVIQSNDVPNGSLSLLATPIIGTPKVATPQVSLLVISPKVSPLAISIVGTPKVSIEPKSIQLDTSTGDSNEVQEPLMVNPSIDVPNDELNDEPNDEPNGPLSLLATPINGTPKVTSSRVSPLATPFIGTPKVSGSPSTTYLNGTTQFFASQSPSSIVDSPTIQVSQPLTQTIGSPKETDSRMATPNCTHKSQVSLFGTPFNGSSKIIVSPPTPKLDDTTKVACQSMTISQNDCLDGVVSSLPTQVMDCTTHLAAASPNVIPSNNSSDSSLSLLGSPIIGSSRGSSKGSSKGSVSRLATPMNGTSNFSLSPLITPTIDSPLISGSQTVPLSNENLNSSTNQPTIGTPKASRQPTPLTTPIVNTPEAEVSKRSIPMDTPTVGSSEPKVPKMIDSPKVQIESNSMVMDTSTGDSNEAKDQSMVIQSNGLTNGSSKSSSFVSTPIIKTSDILSSLPTPFLGTPKVPVSRRSMDVNTPTCGMASSICSLESISFSSADTLEQSRRDVLDSTCLSMIVPFTEVTDHCDSILVYAEEKSFLSSSYDEEPSMRAPKNDNYSTTFIASLFNETCAESELESADECFDFIENSIFSKLPTNVIDFSSIDPKLTKYVVDLNDDCATTEFMAKNFFVHLKYSIIDAEKSEVQLEDVSIECTIDRKIAQKVYSRISVYSPHLLTKPRDDKFIQLMKKVVAAHFAQFKADYLNRSNSLSVIIKGLQKMFYRSEALFVDLYNTCSFYEWKIINADIRNFEIAFETFGMRYTLWLVLSFDLLAYPNENITVKFGVHKADIKRYPYFLFHKVMRSVEPGTNDYIARIVKTAKKFVLDWRHNHSKKQIRLSIHPCRRTLGGDQTRNFNQTNI